MAHNKLIIRLFEKSGEVGPQPILLKKMKVKFLEMNWKEFSTSFLDGVMSVIVTESTIQCVFVNNILQFAANCVAVVSEVLSKDGYYGMHLMTDIVRLCRTYSCVHNKAIRWRFCFLLKHLLNYMAEGKALAVEMCDVVTVLLLDRLQDNKPEVRAQAAHALNRLQTPNNPKCRIVENYLFHMTSDPSADVRAAIVQEIAMYNNVVDEMLKSSFLDISHNVRKEAYKRFLTFPFLNLSSKQRQQIVEKGLDEREGSIKSLMKNHLLPNWLEECDNDFVQLLEKIGVENEIVCEKALNIIFDANYDSQVLDLTNKFLNPVSCTIDFNKLTVENIVLWKCVAKYLTIEKKIELARNQGHVDNDYIDILLPDLIIFSNYVREYYFKYNSNDDKEFILIQLLDMTKTFSIDDVGAESINKLCYDIVLDSNTSVRPIRSIAKLLDITFKNGQDLLFYVKEILNEIQTRTIDVHPLINKVGEKENLEHEITSKSKSIQELLNTDHSMSNEVDDLMLKFDKIKERYNEIDVSSYECELVDLAVKYILKAFELIYQIQQLSKVDSELSLLTDIIQNIVVCFLDCSMVKLRMEAIHSLAPYMLTNNATAAKQHLITLCCEISKDMTDRHLLFTIMFDLFLRYDLKTFDMTDNLDTGEEFEDDFTTHNILPLLANCIDYEVIDSSFKSIVVKGFCDLLMFKSLKSISLVSKLLIIWFRRATRETFNTYNNLVKFFTSYMFYIQTSSSTLAKCYVPVLKEIDEKNLTSKLNIKLDEVNSTLINLTRGLMFRNEKLAVNAHAELASYIFDYLVENQPYTGMLVDTLYKLEIDFNNDNKLVQLLGPKLKHVIKHMSNLNNKNTHNYLKKIKHKFKPILQEKKILVKKRGVVNKIEIEPQVPLTSTQEPDPIEQVPCSGVFSQELMDLILSDSDSDTDDKIEDNEDDDVIEFTKLEAMKRMSEIFKKSLDTKSMTDLISDSD